MKSKKIFSDVKIIGTEFYGQVLQSHICCDARRDPNNTLTVILREYYTTRNLKVVRFAE